MEKIFRPGMVLHSRYRLIKLLGRGVFGLVVQAEDISTGDKPLRVAIKIMRDRSSYGDPRTRE